MTREVADIYELENILDVFQNIRDREVGRRPNQSGTNNNSHYTPQRGSPPGHAYNKQGNHIRDVGWKCMECSGENYVGTDFCLRCKKPRPNPVSYTHLDVYKRQLLLFIPDWLGRLPTSRSLMF